MEKERLEEILENIETEPELRLFFMKLFENRNYSKLFFMRREDLFPTQDNNSLTYFFWNNLQENDEFAVNVLMNQAELKSMRTQQGHDSVSGIVTDGLEDPLKDLIMYTVIQYVRDNPEVKKLIDSEKFDYALMKQILGNYQKLNSKVFDKMNKVTTGLKIDDLDYTKLILSITKIFQEGQKYLAKYVGDFIPALAENRPELYFQIHLNYREHLKSLLEHSGLSREEYLETLKDAFSIKSISNVHTMFWCSNCVDESVILNTDSYLHPRHLNLQCPRCHSNMLCSSVFQLDELIEDCIMDNDGLIKTASAWQFKNNNIEYETFQDEEYEYDLICKIPENNILIECRMHKSQYDENTLKNWLRDDLNQLSKHYNKIKDSREIKHPIFVSNIDVNKHQELISKTVKEYGPEFIYAHISALPFVISTIKEKLNQSNI